MSLDPRGLMANHLTVQGWILFHLARYEEALVAFEQALGGGGAEYDAFAYEGLGQTLAQLKRYEEAVAAFDQALRLEPEDEYLLRAKQRVLTKLHH